MERLCTSYWYPLYAHVRRCGYGLADAEDLTQGYFERLFELGSLAAVGREKGKFRSFLLAGMNHFLADERDRATAQKRDARKTVSFDSGLAETRYLWEPADTGTPECLFERRWAGISQRKGCCRSRCTPKPTDSPVRPPSAAQSWARSAGRWHCSTLGFCLPTRRGG